MPFLIQKYFGWPIHLRTASNFQEMNNSSISTFHILGPTPFEQYLYHFLCKPKFRPYCNLQTNPYQIFLSSWSGAHSRCTRYMPTSYQNLGSNTFLLPLRKLPNPFQLIWIFKISLLQSLEFGKTIVWKNVAFWIGHPLQQTPFQNHFKILTKTFRVCFCCFENEIYLV